MAVAGIALLVLSCGDGNVGPPPPPPTPVPTTVTVSPASATLTALEETVRFNVEVRDQNGQAMTGAAVAWVSSDASVASVDGSGLVTAVANGSATITAAAGSVSGTAGVTVAQSVDSVSLTPMADTVVQTDTLRLSAEAADANGHPVAGTEFAWASSDTLVAVVDGEGLVTAAAAGEAEIVAVSSGVSGRAQITVVAPEPTRVAVKPDTVRFMALEQSAHLDAEVSDQAGRVMQGVPVSWSSADTLVATVDSTGVVTAMGSGATRVTALAGGASGDVVVIVMQSVSSIVVSPPADTIGPSDTLRLAAEAFDGNGHVATGVEFSWSSSDTAVATVNASGLVTGFKEGMATITAHVGDTQGSSEITVDNPDRAALVALFRATDGPKWHRRDNWVTAAPLSEWYGVEIGPGGRVVVLEMYGNGLTGTLPPELGKLTSLESLYLPRNALTGAIPPELGNLARLRTLDLSVNTLTGQIPPGLGNLTGLRELSLGSNALTGPIPSVLGNLTGLRWLYLSRNGLTGSIPSELRNLTNLSELSLSNNALTGPIPHWLGNLATLRGLGLGGNELTGSIPLELGNLLSLRWLDLGGGNSLTGPIPNWLGNLVNLGSLDLGRNALTGPIPPALGNLTSLRELDLHANELNGPIPPELGSLSSLTYLNLSINNLTGPIPPELGNLVGLERKLDLHSNDLTGPIPPGLGNLVSLKWLDLGINKLTGPLPAELGNLVSLETELRLGSNDLAGPIPPELGNLVRLKRLDLAANRLSGPIPSELGKLARLESLYMPGNAVTGPIPPELGNLTSLRYLTLSNNDLAGPIPPELVNLVRLIALEVGGNPHLCVPTDRELQRWLTQKGVYPLRCPPDPSVRLLPRALMREDGNGLSLALPEDLRDPSTVIVSHPSVVVASVSDGWLELVPRGRGSAEVRVIPSGEGTPAVAGVVVRAAIGTFGIDIVMDQPAPLGYEEAMTLAADWWSSALDGTEWPDSRPCYGASTTALADELLIQAGSADLSGTPLSSAAAIARVCFKRSAEDGTFSPGGGRIEANRNFQSAAGDADIMRHEIGHILGLVSWPSFTGLVTEADEYFVGPRAVEVFRAGGGDANLPGVPIGSGSHWHWELVQCELMGLGGICGGVPGGRGYHPGLVLDEPDAVSLAALADAGYTVDMSKATPWRKPENIHADGLVAGKLLVDHVVVEWVWSRKPQS